MFEVKTVIPSFLGEIIPRILDPEINSEERTKLKAQFDGATKDWKKKYPDKAKDFLSKTFASLTSDKELDAQQATDFAEHVKRLKAEMFPS